MFGKTKMLEELSQVLMKIGMEQLQKFAQVMNETAGLEKETIAKAITKNDSDARAELLKQIISLPPEDRQKMLVGLADFFGKGVIEKIGGLLSDLGTNTKEALLAIDETLDGFGESMKKWTEQKESTRFGRFKKWLIA